MIDLDKYIDERIEYLTSCVNFQYGFTNIEDSYARLSELKGLTDRLCAFAASNRLRKAIQPLKEKIEVKYKLK